MLTQTTHSPRQTSLPIFANKTIGTHPQPRSVIVIHSLWLLQSYNARFEYCNWYIIPTNLKICTNSRAAAKTYQPHLKLQEEIMIIFKALEKDHKGDIFFSPDQQLFLSNTPHTTPNDKRKHCCFGPRATPKFSRQTQDTMQSSVTGIQFKAKEKLHPQA